MSIIPKTMGLVIPGNMVKHWDKDAKETTLDITSDQADHMIASLTSMKELYARLGEINSPSPTPPAPELKSVPAPETSADAAKDSTPTSGGSAKS